MASPRLYATFLLWLLAELFEELPEIGDPDKPVLCFFFDEAHLLFDDAPPGLLEKVEQVVRLIRSKGVGVYFITQNPIDIPDKVAAQLNNRIQHKFNAFTPRDQQAVKAAADTFRINPAIDVATAITELKIGEALVSLAPARRRAVAGAADPDQAAGEPGRPADRGGAAGDPYHRRDRRPLRCRGRPRERRGNPQGQGRRMATAAAAAKASTEEEKQAAERRATMRVWPRSRPRPLPRRCGSKPRKSARPSAKRRDRRAKRPSRP